MIINTHGKQTNKIQDKHSIITLITSVRKHYIRPDPFIGIRRHYKTVPFLATGYESVRILIGTTIPDPSLRIIILIIILLYTYSVLFHHLSLGPWPSNTWHARGKVPCTLNPQHCLILPPICWADFAWRHQVVPPDLLFCACPPFDF